MKNTTKIMFCMVLFSSNTQALHKNLYEIPMPTIQSIEEVVALFPKTVKQIKELTETTIKKAEQQIATLLQIPLDQLTFDNTVRVFDRTVDTFSRTIAVLEITFMLYPQANLREAAQKEVVKLRQLFVDLFSQNKDLYLVLARHEQTRAPLEDLTEQERYFMQETLKEYRRHGLDLPEDERTAIKALQKELANLTTLFEKNINDDTSYIAVNLEELKGIDQDFINTLKKTNDGLYILGVDYPTYYKIMEQCETESTRKKLYETFSNRAYPANIEVLEKIIAKRDALAKLLNFESFAHLNIASEMAKSPEIVEEFLNTVLEKAQAKEASEFERLMQALPPTVTLSDSGKLQPWDKLFVNETYKKQLYNIDEYKIAEYFPLGKTLGGLLAIYQQFFSLKFEQVPVSGLWHREVLALKVYRNNIFISGLLTP